jgi:hypothetical protein
MQHLFKEFQGAFICVSADFLESVLFVEVDEPGDGQTIVTQPSAPIMLNHAALTQRALLCLSAGFLDSVLFVEVDEPGNGQTIFTYSPHQAGPIALEVLTPSDEVLYSSQLAVKQGKASGSTSKVTVPEAVAGEEAHFCHQAVFVFVCVCVCSSVCLCFC